MAKVRTAQGTWSRPWNGAESPVTFVPWVPNGRKLELRYESGLPPRQS